MATTKSKQVLAYLYRYALERGNSKNVALLVPHGKIGVILWKAGIAIYHTIYLASDEDREEILFEIKALSEDEIEQRVNHLVHSSRVMNPMGISVEDRMRVLRDIYQTLRYIENQNINTTKIINSINRILFKGNNIISEPNISISAQHIGHAIVKTIINNETSHQNLKSSKKYPQIDGFEIQGLLATGAYADVYLAKDKITQYKERICALKIGVFEHKLDINQEIDKIKSIQHQHILNDWDMGIFELDHLKYYWISMPNMGGISLEHLILGGKLDLETKLLILMQIINGLVALHGKGIIHRNLKPSNLLISDDFDIKISDFGFSNDFFLRHQINHEIGISTYMSPEQLSGQSIGFESDIWSFGMIAYEILKGDLPWGRGINTFTMIGNIQHVDIDMMGLANIGISLKILDIIGKCLKRDQHQRYTSAIELKDNLYLLIKEDRSRLRHNQFKDSWHTLIEKNVIEDFIIDQIKQGVSVFKINAFLSQSEVCKLSLKLDVERLEELLDYLSKVSIEIGLSKFAGKLIDHQQHQILKNQLLSRKELSMQAIDQEIAQELSKIPPNEIAKKLEILSNQQKQKKLLIENQFNKESKKLLMDIEDTNREFNSLMIDLKNKLRIQMHNELKDFDEIKVDQKLIVIDKDESKKMNTYWLFGICFIILLFIFILIDPKNDQKEKISKLDIIEKKETELVSEDQSTMHHFEVEYIDKFMIKIMGGAFMMGSKQGNKDESPIHHVEVGDFYISKTEVTVEQYRKCVDAKVCSLPDNHLVRPYCNWGYVDRDKHPINCIDWKQARVFAKWVGGDLPSEAQWEYASRSRGKEIKYPWGNEEANCQYAVMNDESGNSGCGLDHTWEVCSKTMGNTEEGLCDMGGNVWEWMLDEWYGSYSNAPSVDIAWCSDVSCSESDSINRVYRGGGWLAKPSNLYTVNRAFLSPIDRPDNVGFRVVRRMH
jgi:formylglycine-generating enzyme required for sulfatase activity/serine/threonine protein kinase